MLTVRTLVEEVGLELVAGKGAADTPVRWVHITELLDPIPWLSGGELLLTTGIQLADPEEQRRFVERLVEHHLAGLGFGSGFGHDGLPDALVDEAQKRDFPLFEVPYEMPFIAITETAFTTLVNEHYDVLRRGVAMQKRLEQLVLDERGLEEVTRALAAAIGGAVLVFDSRGQEMVSSRFRRELAPEELESISSDLSARAGQGRFEGFVPSHPSLDERSLALPAGGGGAGAEAWLVAVRDGGALGDFERLLLQQAVTVVALELMRRRVVRDTERRLSGSVLAEALAGLDSTELTLRLRPFGIGDRTGVLVFRVAEPMAAERTLDRLLAERGLGALVATRDDLLCAVVDGSEDPVALASELCTQLADHHGEVRAGASRVAEVAHLRRGYHEARLALEAGTVTNGRAGSVSSYRDLGAFRLLLSLQDDEALSLYCDSVLSPLDDAEGEYGEELLRSLEAFIEENGQWERASRRLFCHRHTLRYRIRRIEELTGRDLTRAQDRIEFWLALRGRELVA